MKIIIITAVVGILVTGCATSTSNSGTVAMKINNKTSHVHLNSHEVQKGDKVIFRQNVCRKDLSSPYVVKDGIEERVYPEICKVVIVGEGTVSKILNKNYSEVVSDGTFNFKEGTFVEKKKQ